MLFLNCAGCTADAMDDEDGLCKQSIELLSMNQIQVIASHNSYRLSPPEYILQLLMLVRDTLPPEFDPQSLDYSHLPLKQQFDQYRIRGIELDVFRDPDGGLFYYRRGDELLGRDPDSREEALLDPGLKILHFPDFDYLTHHLTFKDALEAVREWSKLHPNHLPLSIVVQTKEDSPGDLIPGLGLTTTYPFDRQGVEEVENEILDIFQSDMDHLITPDLVKGHHESLKKAVEAGNWPALIDGRGKLFFILLGTDNAVDAYVEGHPSLAGRTMFVFTNPEANEAAFLKVDDPVGNFELIQEMVKKGFMVRTRSDADTYEARAGDYSRMMAAINSGAQIIATDYYKFDERALEEMGWTDYEVHFPNRELAVINPTNGPANLEMCFIGE